MINNKGFNSKIITLQRSGGISWYRDLRAEWNLSVSAKGWDFVEGLRQGVKRDTFVFEHTGPTSMVFKIIHLKSQ